MHKAKICRLYHPGKEERKAVESVTSRVVVSAAPRTASSSRAESICGRKVSEKYKPVCYS